MKHLAKTIIACLCSMALVLSMFVLLSPLTSAASSASFTLRIEGQKATVLPQTTVTFTPGSDSKSTVSFYDLMAETLSKKGIQLKATLGDYGHEITSIGGESGSSPLWWHLYVNDKFCSVGADSLFPQNGDNIVFYLGDDSVVHYPTVTVTPKNPIAGEKATISVSASYTDYSNNNPVDKTVAISGASISFNGVTYKTDSQGNVTLIMPAAGSYTFRAAKETADSTPAIVRTGDIPLTVYTAQTVPSGSGSDTGSTTAAQTPTVSEKAVASALLSGTDYITSCGVTDWGAALALASAGKKVPDSFFTAVQEDLESYGDSITATHLAGDILGLKAAGADPRSFNGKNLIAELYNMKKIGNTGLNGFTYTLLALDSGNYSLPKDAAVTRDSLISGILSFQKGGGSFSLDKNSAPDSDMTAAAITALAPYMDKGSVKTSVTAAVAYLSKIEKNDGGFTAAYTSDETSESTSQVIIALASAGIDPAADTRFVKNGNSPVSNLLRFKVSGGGFAHILGGKADLIATEQAVQALSSYSKLKSGLRIYDLSDTQARAVTVSTGEQNPETGDDGLLSTMLLLSAASLVFLLSRKKDHH